MHDSGSDEKKEDDEAEEGEADGQWGADFSLCKVGVIAIVKWISEDKKSGIYVMDVEKIDHRRKKFSGRALQCTPNLTSPNCLTARRGRA